MADMLHTNFSSNSSIFSLFSPLTLSPHSTFSFVRFAPLRRRFFHSSFVTKLCSDSSQFEIISRIELADGSVSFKFGDASEISGNLEDNNGGIEVELERESDESLEGNVVNDDENDSERTKVENFDRNSVELKEIGEENADNVVNLQSDAQFSGNSVEDEQNCGLNSVVGVENLSDFDAGKYENKGGNGDVTMRDSSVGVVIGKDEGLSEGSKEKSDDDEVEHGVDERSNVGGMSLDVKASGVVETLEDEVVKNEVVSLEDEYVKDGTVAGDVVEGDVVSLEEDETVKGGILEDEIVKDDIVENEIVKAGVVEDKVVSLEENGILKGDIVKDEIVEDMIEEDKVVSSMEETLKGDIVKDVFVEDEIEEGKVMSLVEETIKGDIRDIVRDEIEEDKVVSSIVETMKDNIVKDEIVENEIGEGKVVSLVEETVKDNIVKEEIVEDDVEVDKVVSKMEETVECGIVKDEIVEDEIEEDKVLSLVDETLKGNIVKDKIVEDEIGEGKVDSMVEETVKGDVVKDKIVEDEIEVNKVGSLVDETMKGDIEDKVVSFVDDTVKDDIVEGEIEEDKVVSSVDETVKGDVVKDESEEKVVALEIEIIKGSIGKDDIVEDKVVSLENETVKNGIVEDEIVEDEIVKKAVVKDEIAEYTSVSLKDETEKACVLTVNHPIPMDEDDDSVELMSKKFEAEPILEEETSSELQDDVVGLGSFLDSNKVHDAINNTVTQSGDDITNSLVAAGPITSEISSPEIGLDSLNEAEPSSPAFSLSSAVASLEHFPEALTGGKDAHFVSKNWFGVADGVGQWSLGGVDMGLYAHEFMQNCEKLLKSTSARLTNVKQLLQQSAAITQSTGAARVLIAHLDKEVLHVANIGDSGFVIIRNGTVVQKSSPMVHEFSFPYAIGLGDDSVEDAEEYHIDLEDGDVIITATDGLFDNLYDQEIASMVSKVLEAGMTLQVTPLD
ncbi:probable protein phosphatase 2C 62 isoform X2 [Chenopodium quinoa]|uniref:probable protein phosphatase 2C 62 isoform X2 n=1 Tax=Chenopodium quinoa TaxID=63459 RepID=UPI000B779841|nr:probable protein phosphatase 2C 62 isoform X2 [Chenopodium quinoa]